MSIFKFPQHVLKYNIDAVRKLLERLNDASEAENCYVCMWIVERRFPEDYCKHEYRKINAVSENKN